MSSTVLTSPLLGIARDAGVRDALHALHAQLAPRGLACGESGWTIAPDDLSAIECVVLGERRYGAAEVTLTMRDTPALRHAGLAAVHAQPSAAGERCPAADLARETGRLRLGLALGLTDTVRAHLTRRSVAGAPLVRQQLVKGLLAEATLDLLAAGARLDPAGPSDAAARAHAAITRAGRTLAGLLGASGYLVGDPGATLHVSELIENVCVGRPRPPRDPAS
jgi:hypothetical protein